MTSATLDPIDLSLPVWRDDPKQLQSALLAQVPTGVVLKADLARPADTLTVQLLLAARTAAKAKSTSFDVHDPSDAFRDGLRMLGLHDQILA